MKWTQSILLLMAFTMALSLRTTEEGMEAIMEKEETEECTPDKGE